MRATRTIALLASLLACALPARATPTCANITRSSCLSPATPKTPVANFSATTPEACCSACAKNPGCLFWSWNDGTRPAQFHPNTCYLRNDVPVVVKAEPHSCAYGYGMQPAPPPAPKNARNVLYILVDDLRTELNAYGHDFIHSPNIDAFAASPGTIKFTNAHVQSQMCVPTRNSFMSGRRPPTTKVFNDGIGLKSFRNVGANWTALPQYFKESGYFTTGVGKTFHPNTPPNFDQPYSWSDPIKFPYYYPQPQKCPTAKDVWCEVTDSNATYEDTLILEEARRRMKIAASDPSRPFFLAVGFHKPHTPYRSPSRFFEMYPPADQIALAKHPDFPTDQNLTGLSWFSCLAEGAEYPINHTHNYPAQVQGLLRRAYYSAVSFTDDNIGQLLATLTELGLDSNTVVALHGDHGYQLGEKNIYCKETNFNLATHVPLMVRAPQYAGKLKEQAFGGITEIVDVFPTLADLAGLPPLDPSKKGEPPLGGKSLRPVFDALASLDGAPSSSATAPVSGLELTLAFSQYGRHRCLGDLFQTKCPKQPTGLFMGYTVRNGTYRYTRWVNISNTFPNHPDWDLVRSEELYSHAADQGDDYDDQETVNLAYHSDPTSQAVLAQLRQVLKAQFASGE